jgi:hypothetical protein
MIVSREITASMSSSIRSLHQGIAAIQAGHLQEGARLIKIALRDDMLTGSLRATAYLWLANTTEDRQQKINDYSEALTADPNNDLAKQWLAELIKLPANHSLAQPPPPGMISGGGGGMPVTQPIKPITGPLVPTPVNTPQQQPMTASYHIVGILDGPNGPGSGFFVARNGIIVTTRYVVGGLENVTVELETRRQLSGRVVRSYPDMDITFIYIEQPVNDLLPATPFPNMADNAPLNGIAHGGLMINGRKRETSRAIAAYWFPTDIDHLPDAGGCPVFDERHYVVGMLTLNHTSTAAYVHGVHIAAIMRCLDTFFQEMQVHRDRIYCHSCGGVSRVAAAGGFYCENCGTTMPFAENIRRISTPQMAMYYQENHPTACPNCGARAGFHNGLCLRCGIAGNPMVSR